MTDEQQDLAGADLSVAQLQRQIQELEDRLNAGAAVHVSRAPLVSPATPATTPAQCEALSQELTDAVTAAYPAQCHVSVVDSFGVDHQILLDQPLGRVSFVFNGKSYSLPADRCRDYWLQDGHRLPV